MDSEMAVIIGMIITGIIFYGLYVWYPTWGLKRELGLGKR